jgi:hypothetical protein
MSSAQTTKRHAGELTGTRQAKCFVRISKKDGVKTFAIDHVEPHGIVDRDYTLTVEGEPTTRWNRDYDGWKRLK